MGRSLWRRISRRLCCRRRISHREHREHREMRNTKMRKRIGFLRVSSCPSWMFLLSVLSVTSVASLSFAQSPLSWGDQGDGTYKNPILSCDFSDPDVIRVGADFYLVASDFNYVGMQVLHSRDLVNWQIIGQVFNRLTMDAKYDAMKGNGE